MDSTQASRMVILSGAGMASFVLVQTVREGRPQEKTFRSLWAIGLVTLGLAIFADFAPEVAGPFALLVLIAMAVRNTGVLGSVLGGGGVPAAPRLRSPDATPSQRQSSPPDVPGGAGRRT